MPSLQTLCGRLKRKTGRKSSLLNLLLLMLAKMMIKREWQGWWDVLSPDLFILSLLYLFTRHFVEDKLKYFWTPILSCFFRVHFSIYFSTCVSQAHTWFLYFFDFTPLSDPEGYGHGKNSISCSYTSYRYWIFPCTCQSWFTKAKHSYWSSGWDCIGCGKSFIRVNWPGWGIPYALYP